MPWQVFRPSNTKAHSALSRAYLTVLTGCRSTSASEIFCPPSIRSRATNIYASCSALGSTIIRATYGLETAETGDKYIVAAERATDDFLKLLAASASSVLQYIPALARAPTWLPGTGFLRQLEHVRNWTYEMRTMPWEDGKAQIVSNFPMSSGMHLHLMPSW